jgi:hypothetical protein
MNKMVNDSKKQDLRFWEKWKESGAVSNLEEIFYIYRTPAPKPSLGPMVYLHQSLNGSECIYCGTPIKEWITLEKCYSRIN